MKIKRFQQGGQAPAQPAQPGPEEQLMQMAQQIIQQLGPEASAMLAQMLMEMLQGGGQQTPQQEQSAPVYAKKGGKLTRVSKN